MKSKAGFFLVILLSSFALAGCMAVVIGAAVGTVGGYAASKDTIQGESDKSYDRLWNSAREVSRIRGLVKHEDPSTGLIELEAESSRVVIRLVRLTRATTRLKVSARKYHLPNISLAQDIFVKIMEGIK